MKKLLLIISVFCFVQIKAQTNVYHPFPTVYGDWQLYENDYGGTGSTTSSYLYYVSGDTIVHSLNYKKVNYINQGQCYCPATPLNQQFTGGSYNFAYRNDSTNKRVYILLSTDTVERLWYDFNLNMGDTLKNTYSVQSIYPTPPLALQVSVIDSVQICNKYYKRFKCSCPIGTPFEPIYLTESVGFSTHFIYVLNSDNCQMEPYRLYTTNAWSVDDCPNGFMSISNHTSTTVVSIYPSPVRNTFTIETNSTEKQMLFVFDVNGKLVLNQFISGTTTIDASNLNAGVYSLSITSSQGTQTKKLVVVK